ncbi:MAG TPA: S9 family peptidase [Vicinamibacterales bacterium]|nr:S9 family peptidase [Vicinamibacterales bacterium]
MRVARVRALGALLIVAVALAAPGAQSKRPITELDLFKFTWIGDTRVSPDGRQVAFARVTVNEKDDTYDTALWMVPTDASAPPRPLTSGTRDSAPRWSPDGRQLAFVRAPMKDGRPQPPQVFLLDMSGGEARQLTDLARGAGAPEWSPDGKMIAFSSTTTAKDQAGRERADERKERPRESDVRVITRAVYRANGGGYADPVRRSHIWTIAVPAAGASPEGARPITSGAFDEQGFAWSPDGRWIYFTSNRVEEPYYHPQDSDLYAVPAGGGDIVKVASIDGAIRGIAPSPDGRQIAFIGAAHGRPVRSFDQPDLFVTDATPGSTPRNLTASYDFEIGGGIGGDQRAPRAAGASAPAWSRDGRSIFAVVSEHGSANIKRIDVATGKIEPFTTGNHHVMSYTAAPGSDRFAMVISTPTNIGDLFAGDGGTLSRITSVNDGLFSGIVQREPEEFWFTSFDGNRIQGWILKPPDFEEGQKYPLILEIHGGPHSAYGNTFTHEFSWMAAKGFVVLYTNPRGSTSYGQEFANIIQHNYPGDDYKDLMAGVDALLERGYIDGRRMGVTGGSGGGVLTNWTIGQTTRFAAAVSQRSIADWTGFWYTADFTLFQPTWFKGAPWEDPQDFARRSPITHIAKVTTPLMLIEGEDDLRTPPADGGEQMFRALKYLKRPVVMVRFPGETHELSRSGKPWHRIERLQHIVGWFEKYLQGKKIETYDQ